MGPLHDSSRFKSGTPVPSPGFFGLGRNVSTWRAGLADKKRGRGPGSLRSGRRSARNAPRRERLKRPKTTAPTATQTNVPVRMWGGSSALQARISVWRASLGGLGGSVWARHVCPGSGPGSFSRRRESWHLPTDRDASEGNCKPTEPCV